MKEQNYKKSCESYSYVVSQGRKARKASILLKELDSLESRLIDVFDDSLDWDSWSHFMESVKLIVDIMNDYYSELVSGHIASLRKL